jgi:hypothetical protein
VQQIAASQAVAEHLGIAEELEHRAEFPKIGTCGQPVRTAKCAAPAF